MAYTGEGHPPDRHLFDPFDTREFGETWVHLHRPIEPGHWLVLRLTASSERGTATFEVQLAHLPLDFNQDGQVDIRDATAFGELFRHDEPTTLLDLNGDSQVDIRDATTFGQLWHGESPATKAWAGSALPERPK